MFSYCEKEEPIIDNPPPPVEECSFSEILFDNCPLVFDLTSNTYFYAIQKDQDELEVYLEVLDSNLQIFINEQAIDNFSLFNFTSLVENPIYNLRLVDCDSSTSTYQIAFSSLPIISIQRNNVSIIDEPKRAVEMQLYDPYYIDNGFNEYLFKSTIGIEFRGGSAQIYPKHSYGFELWANESGDEKYDHSLFGMRDDDDWILDAMYIDQSKMRNRVSTDLWYDINSLHYENSEPDARNATQGIFVEVFMDNKYHGLYTFTERMDKKQLQLKSTEPNDLDGLLYKSVTWGDGLITFEAYTPPDSEQETWDGWLQKYPDPDDFISWQELDSLSRFVILSGDSLFNADLSNYFFIENLVDYFILLNVMRGDDNRGKNVFLARYNNDEPFFMIPWDMDATWGRDFIAMETNTNDILSNGLFDRLLENNTLGFRQLLKQRWQTLRNDQLNNEALKSRFNNYSQQFKRSKAFERESIRWNFSYDLDIEIQYIENWIDGRLLYLDNYIQTL